MGDDTIKPSRSIHIGLIPDGNRRYAVDHHMPVWWGHKIGAKRIEQFLGWCMKWPQIKQISIFALSTENLNRPEWEKSKLWQIYREKFRQMADDERIKSNGIQVHIVGDKGLWRPDVTDAVKELVRATKGYSKHILNIMLAYGSKFEINQAIKKAIKKPVETVDKTLFVSQPLDLVIRTGGQHRLSNFMLYQASYAEVYFSQTLWPAFTKKEFDKIIRWYFEQQRKFGV